MHINRNLWLDSHSIYAFAPFCFSLIMVPSTNNKKKAWPKITAHSKKKKKRLLLLGVGLWGFTVSPSGSWSSNSWTTPPAYDHASQSAGPLVSQECREFRQMSWPCGNPTWRRGRARAEPREAAPKSGNVWKICRMPALSLSAPVTFSVALEGTPSGRPLNVSKRNIACLCQDPVTWSSDRPLHGVWKDQRLTDWRGKETANEQNKGTYSSVAAVLGKT